MHHRSGAGRRAPFLIAVALAGAMIVASACAGDPAGDGATSTGGTRAPAVAGRTEYAIKVGVLKQPHLSHALFYDMFLPQNVKLEVVPFTNSTEIKSAVAGGSIDFGITGITAALQGAAADEPVVVVASAADGGSAIVARKDAGITKVTDLKGKRIGYVAGSAQDILLRLTLRDAGLDATTDVELVKVQFADMANALERGDIDAFSGAETGPSDALVRNTGVLVTHPYDTKMAKINIVLVTSRNKIATEPELVEAIVATHAHATNYMNANKDQWAGKVVSSYGFPEASLDMAIANIELRWTMDEAYAAQVEVLGEQQVSLAQIPKEPDYGSFIDLQFVRKVAAQTGSKTGTKTG